ncbi:MAG: hypothetical protein IPI58_05030 [Alphaproteobacteria bacterium]|nr:MAG: hypothetical protein IPI58_05030 [Alphaproteobacteria bacterium]
MKLVALSAMMMLSLSACMMFPEAVPPKAISFRDTAVAAPTDRIMVLVAGTSLEERQRLERRLERQLGAVGVVAFPSVDAFPPTRPYTPPYVVQALSGTGATMVLAMVRQGSTTTKDWLPENAVQSQTRTIGTLMAGMEYAQSQRRGGERFGGFSAPLTNTRFDALLFNVATGQVAWRGLIASGGSLYSEFHTKGPFADDPIQVISEKTVWRLGRDGVVPLPKED